jgi:hypothetical protein
MHDRPLTPPTIDGDIAEGTVGWASDGGNAIDLGDSPNDGNSLVRVTLFRGRDATQPPSQTGAAQGQELLCRLATTVLAVPVYGARVIVVIPQPWGMSPGGPVIICEVDPTLWKRFGNLVPGDRIIAAGAGQLVMKLGANGAWAVKTTIDGTPTGTNVYLQIGPLGLAFSSPWASAVGGKQQAPPQAAGWFFGTAWGSALKLYGASGLPGLPASLKSIAKLTAGILKLDGSTVNAGPDVPGAQFVPTAAAQDPGGAPMLAALLTALTTFAEAVQSVVAPLGANPTMTGVTPAQVAAVADAGSALTTACETASLITTTTAFKVSSPAP